MKLRAIDRNIDPQNQQKQNINGYKFSDGLSNVSKKRQNFHFELRKKKIEQEFNKKRMQLIRQNENNDKITRLLAGVMANLPQKEKIDQEKLAILTMCVQVARKISVCQLNSEIIIDFLYFLGVAVEKYERQSQSLQKEILKIANIVYQLLNTVIESNQCARFFQKIYTVSHSGIFIQIHKQIYKSSCFYQVKEKMFNKFMIFLMNKRSYFFDNRLSVLQIIQVAILSPSLSQKCSGRIIQNIDNLLHLMSVKEQQKFEMEQVRIFKIIQKLSSSSHCILSFENISSLIGKKIVVKHYQTACIDIASTAVCCENFNFNFSSNSHSYNIIDKISKIAQEISTYPYYNREEVQLIKSLIYFFINFVCDFDGANFFRQNLLQYSFISILEKCGNVILKPVIFLMINSIYSFFKREVLAQEQTIQIFDNQKYQQFIYLGIENNVSVPLALQVIFKALSLRNEEVQSCLLIVRDQNIRRMFRHKYQTLDNHCDAQLMEIILKMIDEKIQEEQQNSKEKLMLTE